MLGLARAGPRRASLFVVFLLFGQKRVTTSESRGTNLVSARGSPHAPQSKAAWLPSASANLFHLLKHATLRLPFLQRSGAPPPSLATRVLVCSYEPNDVVGYKNS